MSSYLRARSPTARRLRAETKGHNGFWALVEVDANILALGAEKLIGCLLCGLTLARRGLIRVELPMSLACFYKEFGASAQVVAQRRRSRLLVAGIIQDLQVQHLHIA